MTIGGVTLKRRSQNYSRFRISNIRVKKFRLLIKTKQEVIGEFEVYFIQSVAQLPYCDMQHKDLKITAIKKKFSSVFCDDLLDELPPERNIIHQIEIQGDAKPPYKPIF